MAYLKKSSWKKFLASACLLLVLGLLISACGGGDENSESDLAPATTASNAASTVVTSDEVGLLPTTSDFFDIRNNLDVEVPYIIDGDPDQVMTVMYPTGDGPFPALVVVHGTGGRDDALFTDFYAQRGFVGFAIDYQLSNSETPAWPMALQDVICAVRHIKQNAELYNIDRDRVAVMGQGVGGYLALMIGTLQGNEEFLEGACDDLIQDSRVNLVIAYSSFPDLVGYAENQSVSERFENFLGKSYADDPALWRLASPMSYVNSDDEAMFVIGHGSRDQESPIEPVKQFVRKMKESGVDTNFLEIEGGKHTFWWADSQLAHLEEMRHFLEPIMERRLQP